MLSFLRRMSGDVISFGVPFSEEANEDPAHRARRSSDAMLEPNFWGLGVEDDVDDALPLILRPGRVSSHSQRASDQQSGAISPKQLALDRGNAP
jgi:hypothetical protein